MGIFEFLVLLIFFKASVVFVILAIVLMSSDCVLVQYGWLKADVLSPLH